MYYYKIYGLTLSSDYEFPQFVSIDKPEGDADITIEYGMSEEILTKVKKGFWSSHRPHNKWFRNQDGIFWIHDDCKINFIEYGDTIDQAAQFLPGMCLAILLWFRKMIMIHGACLRYKDRTIIIAGDSGSGKSTLTTEFIKKGAMLIADDVTGIRIEDGEYYSYPAFPAQKLCMDQVEKNNIDVSDLRQVKYDLNKYEIPREEIFYDKKSKVDYFFRVDAEEVSEETMATEPFELSTDEITGAEKIKILTDSLFVKFLFDSEFRFEPDDMIRCIGFANKIKMFHIVRNWDVDTLDRIIGYIDENVN